MIATEQLERQLDDFDRGRRSEALTQLWRAAERGEIALPEPGADVNLHAHTFFSYNAYGYSPSKFAWLARKAGLAAAGIVDFDVLDGVEEFLEAGRLIGLKTCVQPGIARVRAGIRDAGHQFARRAGRRLSHGRRVSARRVASVPRGDARRRGASARAICSTASTPISIRSSSITTSDVVPLTPNGNATERHLCEAYERKAVAGVPRPRAPRGVLEGATWRRARRRARSSRT